MTTEESPVEITEALRSATGEAASSIEEDYENWYDWMLEQGKVPRRRKGLNERTVKNYIRRLDQAHRFILEYADPPNPAEIQDEDAEDLLLMIDRGEITKQKGDETGGEEYSESAKRKFSDALQKYFLWQYHTENMDYVWKPKISFSDNKGKSAYRFTYQELGLLFETAKAYGSLPAYYETSTEERNRINGLVAQRLGIPKNVVTREDWLSADWSRKIYALVTVGYDAGLAPIEVANAETSWYHAKAETLRIPSEHACKEREKEEIALTSHSIEAMGEWIKERRHLEKYDGTNKLWLNRSANPYQSGSLCRLLRNLCTEATISTENRKVVWYSLRQTMGRNVTDEGELSEANDQLRHEHLQTTQEGYNETPMKKLQLRLDETHRKAKRAAEEPEYNPFDEDQPRVQTSTSLPATDQSGQESDEVVTSTDGGKTHIDAIINDSTEARVDITKQILEGETKE